MAMKNSNKRQLIVSMMSLGLSVTMLMGTTLAWFTDSSTTNVNTIQAGKLDVDLMMQNSAGEWKSAEGKTLKFKDLDGNTLWEPGANYDLEPVIVRNNGNLALKYKVIITGINGDAELNEAITWNIGGADIGEEYVLLPGESNEITIEGTMKPTATNKYQGKSIDGISIAVVATQYTKENDSTDSNYDEKAEYPDVAHVVGGLTSDKSVKLDEAVQSLKNSTTKAATVNVSGNVELSSVVDSGQGAVGKGTLTSSSNLETVFQGTGASNTTMNIKGTSYATIQSGNKDGVIVFKDMTITDSVRGDSETGWEWRYAQFSGKVRFENCVISTGVKLMEGADVEFINCDFNNTDNDDYGTFITGGKATFEKCRFNGYRGIKAHDYTAKKVELKVNNCTFVASEKPAVDIDNISTNSKITIINNNLGGREVLNVDIPDTVKDNIDLTVQNNN